MREGTIVLSGSERQWITTILGGTTTTTFVYRIFNVGPEEIQVIASGLDSTKGKIKKGESFDILVMAVTLEVKIVSGQGNATVVYDVL